MFLLCTLGHSDCEGLCIPRAVVLTWCLTDVLESLIVGEEGDYCLFHYYYYQNQALNPQGSYSSDCLFQMRWVSLILVCLQAICSGKFGVDENSV